MKRPSWRKRNVLIPSAAFAVGVALLAVAALVLLLRFFIPGVLPAVFAPLWQAGSATASALHTVTSGFADNAALSRERDRLASDNAALVDQNRALTGEVADLRKLVGSRGESAHRVLSGVLARPPVSPYDTLIIDRGTADGVSDSALAYGPGGTPLGTIESATTHTARVALYSSFGRATDGWVGEARIPVTLIGQGGGAFTATLPRDSKAVVGDVVYLPGPGALPIGSIVRIHTDPASPRDTVYLAPYVNLFSLPWIEVGPHL